MKFIIDAQLTFRLSKHLQKQGYDVIHTNDLPQKDITPDNEISEFAKTDGRIVITKDSDFLKSFLVRKTPPKLLMVTTGNLVNADLLQLFDANIE